MLPPRVPVPKAKRVTLTPELPSVTQSVAERLAAAAVSAPPDAATAETAPLSISAAAARRLTKLLAADPGAALRISVNGGGCSGFQYSFEIDATRADDDFVATRDGVSVVVDSASLEMLRGSELDFVDDLMGQAFKVKNPNAIASCGCGVSFSI